MHFVQMREKLRADIVVKMREISDRLSSGSVPDFATYRQLVGRIQGHKDALDLVDAFFDKLVDSDE